MTPPIGYSDTRINSINSAGRNSEFDKWIYSPNFKTVKAIAETQATDNKDRKSFANFLKDAEKQQRPVVILKPANRAAIIDIIE